MYATNSFFCLCCAPLHKLLSRSTDFSIRPSAGLLCLAHGYLPARAVRREVGRGWAGVRTSPAQEVAEGTGTAAPLA